VSCLPSLKVLCRGQSSSLNALASIPCRGVVPVGGSPGERQQGSAVLSPRAFRSAGICRAAPVLREEGNEATKSRAGSTTHALTPTMATSSSLGQDSLDVTRQCDQRPAQPMAFRAVSSKAAGMGFTPAGCSASCRGCWFPASGQCLWVAELGSTSVQSCGSYCPAVHSAWEGRWGTQI